MGVTHMLTLCWWATLAGSIDVSTKYGIVRGQTLELNGGFEVNTFLGVPFAKAPVGSLRWKAPQEPPSWSSPFIADRYGHMCPQLGFQISETHPGFDDFDEDCLHLNIYAPKNPPGPDPYPVMVYFHGGAYQGSGSIQFHGHFLSAENTVVVVANYRLGIIGFMTTGDDTVTPNAGLWDQRQALVFVRDNIAAFGGDPNKVTIFGHSAGGSSVGLHLMSPKSTGLFHRAMCLSGNEMVSWSYGSIEQRPERSTRSVAEKLGCNLPSNVDMVECLRKINASTLVETDPDPMEDEHEFVFAPVVDGEGGFLPDEVDKLRAEGRYNKVPLISGITTDDGTVLMAASVPGALSGNGFNRTEYQRIFRNLISDSLDGESPYRVEQAYQAFHHQYTNWPHVDDLEGNRQSIAKFYTDSIFGLPMDVQIKAHSKESPTYAYLFGYRSANITDDDVPKWMGVTHSGDAPYVFGMPQLKYNPAVHQETGILINVDYNDEDLSYSALTIKLFTNFAKTGNPTPQPVTVPGDGRPIVWPMFDNSDLQHIVITRNTKVSNHYRQRNFALWTEYLPWILTHNETEFL